MPSVKIHKAALPEAQQNLFQAVLDARTAYQATLKALIEVFEVSPTGRALTAMHVSLPTVGYSGSAGIDSVVDKVQTGTLEGGPFILLKVAMANAANPVYDPASRHAPSVYMDGSTINQLLNGKLLDDNEKRKMIHIVSRGALCADDVESCDKGTIDEFGIDHAMAR